MRFTGEQVVPTEMHHDTREMQAHLARYVWAMEWCQNKEVADLACGCGYGSQLLSWAANNVYAVDRDMNSLIYATDHFTYPNIHWRQGDMCNLPIDDNSLDVVVSFETVEHLPEPVAFLDEVQRVLKRGGTFIASAPENSGSVWHVRDFTKLDLYNLLDARFDMMPARYFTQGPRTEIVEDADPLWDHPTHIFVI
jgi:ubiquinone/menaquinone biosynthesis C-methylase UbiE